jgi:uracil-DNA glycosylase
MRELIPADWTEQLGPTIRSEMFDGLADFVARQRNEYPGRIYPPASEVFTALDLTPYDEVRAVILGMDPYPGFGQAHGLAFALRPSATPFPPSLRNILNELERDLGIAVNRDGSLIPWARHGVLLLNTAMTVLEGKPGSHMRKWKFFTDAAIKAVARKPYPVAFMLWGNDAQRKEHLIDGERHPILKSSHPSSRSARINFTGKSPFTRANAKLRRAGQPEIDWRLPPT